MDIIECHLKVQHTPRHFKMLKFRFNLGLLQSMIMMFKSIIIAIIVNSCFKT
jgi:hypothetical protein